MLNVITINKPVSMPYQSNKKRCKIGFVTRQYPPTVGGLERAAAAWYMSLSKIADVSLLANKKGILGLPLFYLITPFVLLSWYIKGIRHLHFHDASLVILLCPFWFFFPRVTTTVNGLDIVYPNPIYRYLLRSFSFAISRWIAISDATAQVCRDFGIPHNRIAVVHDGYSGKTPDLIDEETLNILFEQYFSSLPRKKINLLWVGRMIPRKGILWFIEQVLPKFITTDKIDIALWIVGNGQLRDDIEAAAKKSTVSVTVLGFIDDELLNILRQSADLSLMPNIPIDGDMEGFGLVNLEANVAGTWVAATNIDGIPSSVHNGHNGTLLPANSPKEWVLFLHLWMKKTRKDRKIMGKQAREYVSAQFNLHKLAQHWLSEIIK